MQNDFHPFQKWEDGKSRAVSVLLFRPDRAGLAMGRDNPARPIRIPLEPQAAQ
jgi:hypothetical protein